MIDRIHVYDLDGVLVDTSHRYRNKPDGSIDLDYWFMKRHLIDQDTLLPLVSQYRQDCALPNIYTVVCTARNEHGADKAFINERIAQPNLLIMRPWNDNTRDAVLKRRQLQRIFNLRQFSKLPRKLWEDNLKNINSLRDLFTACYHVPSNITERV